MDVVEYNNGPCRNCAEDSKQNQGVEGFEES